MNREETLNKIIKGKKEFSEIPVKDIWTVYGKFERRQCSEEEKIRLTRDLLRKVYSAFVSGKLLNIKNKKDEWFLRKHLSTRERLNYYRELYKKLLKDVKEKECSIIDLGSGINGFGYKFFPNRMKVNYIAVEAVGQLVNLMNFYFKKNNFNAKAVHESLFELEKIKEIIKETKGEKIIFLFKVIDSLEMLERDYSKKLLLEIVPLCDKIVVSFATKSMIRQDKFKVSRKWIIDFIKENFDLLEDFNLGNERYVVFKGK